MSNSTTLQALIKAPEILVMPAVFDGFSARLIEQRGYKAGLISGAGLSESRLGLPDVGIMGMEENLAGCRAISASCKLPLIADGDTGYGNAVNVYHAVRAFEQAGVAGLLIEDQVWPKRCGHMKGKQVIAAEEMVEKIRAAAEARRDPEFVILGRTDAYATHGLAEAIRRLNLYAEAGADLLLADAVLTEDDIASAARGVSKPLTVNMGFGIRSRPTTALISARRLQELGVAVVIYSRLLSASAIRGMMIGLDALEQDLREGRATDRPQLAVSFDELNDLIGLAAVQALEQRFLTASELKAKYG